MMGGRPSKGTPADGRLKSNKKAPKTPAPFGGKKAPPFQKGGK